MQKKEKIYGIWKIFTRRGGATLLTARSVSLGGVFWEKILRYYDTKALRSNYLVSKPNQQLICHGDVLAEGSQKVNEKLKQVQHDKNFGTICKVQDAKYVSEAHRKHLLPYSLQKKLPLPSLKS